MLPVGLNPSKISYFRILICGVKFEPSRSYIVSGRQSSLSSRACTSSRVPLFVSVLGKYLAIIMSNLTSFVYGNIKLTNDLVIFIRCKYGYANFAASHFP